MSHKSSSLYGMLYPSTYDVDAVCERCHVHRARLQSRHSPYVKVQRPGFDLLEAGNRALASIEFITQWSAAGGVHHAARYRPLQ